MVFKVGIRKVRSNVPALLAEPDSDFTEPVRYTLLNLYEQLVDYDDRERKAVRQMAQCVSEFPHGKRMLQIPGFGPIVTAHWLACVGDGKQFKNGRHCAAWLGLVPRQSGTGGKIQLHGISKNGNRQLRTKLIDGARSLVNWRDRRTDPMTCWAAQLVTEQGQQRAVVALANKLARIAWSVATSGESFEMNKAAHR